ELHAGGAARRPPAHHGVGDFRVELHPVCGRAPAEHLHREGLALGQKPGATGQVEAFAVPLVDVIRPRRAQVLAGPRRPDRIVADLHMAVAMAVDGAAEMARQDLRAEADAEEWLLLAPRPPEPLDLAPDELLLVVGAHRPAEDDGARMVRERLRQRVAEARPPDVERVAATPEDLRHPAWCRMFLMQDEQNG